MVKNINIENLIPLSDEFLLYFGYTMFFMMMFILFIDTAISIFNKSNGLILLKSDFKNQKLLTKKDLKKLLKFN